MAQVSVTAGTRTRAGLGPVVRHVDFVLIASGLLLAFMGVLMVYSATHRSLEVLGLSPTYDAKKQAIFVVLGLIAMAVTAMIDYRRLRLWIPVFYGGVVFLLVVVRTPIGSSALGAQRWFQLGGFQFSPSMFARIALVMMLALVLSNVKGDLKLRDLRNVVLLGALPMFLVFIQPDIGTTIILAAIMLAMLVAAGTKVRYLVALVLVASLAIFGAFQLHVVKEYQVQRLTTFLDPSSNSQTAAYNLQQSEIAVGAGGVTGKGYLKGSQTNLNFVPEQNTDFIFTVVGEELGFVGGVVMLVVFGLLLWRAYRIALLARDPLGTFMAVGLTAMIAMQVFVNVGMTIGIMPITGIPLPFISYGGSALIADFIGLGLLQSIHMHRFS